MSLSDSIREETAIARAWYGHPFLVMARVLAAGTELRITVPARLTAAPVDLTVGGRDGADAYLSTPISCTGILEPKTRQYRKGTRLRSRTHPALTYLVTRVDGDMVTFRPYRRRGRKWRMTVIEVDAHLEEADGISS